MQGTEFDEEELFAAIVRQRELAYTPNVPLVVPCLDDMILTKRWLLRPKDVDDIAILEKLKRNGGVP